MLIRNKIRRYLKAVLWHDDVPQTADCETGLLLDNCTEKHRGIFDSTNDQVVVDGDGQWRVGGTKNAIVFRVGNVTHDAISNGLCNSNISYEIHLFSCVTSASKRQDELDTIEERIWNRLYCYQEFQDATTGENIRPIFRLADGNKTSISISEETEFEGNYTVRSIIFTMDYQECIKRTNCHDKPLCFNWQDLTGLEDCNA